MSGIVNPRTMRAAYEYVRSAPPMRSWRLPPGEEVVFKVGKTQELRGWYTELDGRHIITISAGTISHTSNLIMTMAHEMIHLYQRDTRQDRNDTQHGAAFNKLAARVCKVHGWDPKLF